MNQIQPWNPFKELENMQRSFGDIFGRESFWPTTNRTGTFNPAIDISEDKENLHFKMELPDVKKEDIKVELHDGVLTISGQKKFEKEEKNEDKKFHRIERSYGSFMRSFTMPEYADSQKVLAEFNNGVLDVKVAKLNQVTKKPTTIAIK